MPLAYHLIWTTYGTWLSGDARGWIKKSTAGVQCPDRKLETQSRQRMSEHEITLSESQRSIVEQTIRDHCQIRGWNLHAVNVRTNHIHVVVSAKHTADEVMNQFKAWCSRKLSDAAGLKQPVAVKAGRKHWFTEGGDKKIIEDEEYLRNAIRYVVEGQEHMKCS